MSTVDKEKQLVTTEKFFKELKSLFSKYQVSVNYNRRTFEIISLELYCNNKYIKQQLDNKKLLEYCYDKQL